MRLRRLYGMTLELTGSLFGIAVGAIAVLMTLDIVLRALNIGALPWLVELTEYVLYAGTFLAAPWALRHGAHVRIDVLVVALGRRARATIGVAMDVLGCAVSVTFIWFGVIAVWEAWRDHSMQYSSWATPEWILLAPVPLAAAMLTVEFARRALRLTDAPDGDGDPALRASL